MKFNIQIDMTPDEARKVMGLPDVTGLQGRMMDEMERRIKAAMDTSDPEAMLRAWMPMGGQAFDQFQRFLWDSASKVAGAATPKSTKAPR